MLIERPGEGTRLLVRTCANYSPRAIRFLALPFGMFDATYGVAMLQAIARRAEAPEPAGTKPSRRVAPVRPPEACREIVSMATRPPMARRSSA